VTTDGLRKRIRQKLADKQWSQPRLARAAGCTVDVLKHWLRGNRDIKHGVLVALLGKLGLTLDVQERRR